MSQAEMEVGTEVSTIDRASDERLAPIDERAPVVNVNELMQAALAQGEGGVAALEKLVELEERVARRNAEQAFNAAVSAFHRECPKIPRRDEGATRHGRKIMFANFETIQAVVDPILARHGLAYSFSTRVESNLFITECVLSHEAGHSRASEMPVPLTSIPKATAAQNAVGTRSYGKRVALSDVLGIATTDDLDGADMTGETETIDDGQVATIREYIDAGHAEEDKLLHFLGVASLDLMPANQYDSLINTLKARASRG